MILLLCLTPGPGLILKALQDSPGLFASQCIALPADILVVEIPHLDESLWV